MHIKPKQFISISILLISFGVVGSTSAAAQPKPIEPLPPEVQEILKRTEQKPDQQPAQKPTPPKTEAELRAQYEKSMTYMLQRAKLVRTLAAQHVVFLAENADAPELHLVEEASQVVAFDLVCSDDTFEPKVLDQLATESNYRIAVQAAKSPIAGTLNDIGRQQSITERMNLLGDVATTVFMFNVGRRRGLFDSLMTDFGKVKFCDGLRGNMRERYNTLTSGGDGGDK